MSKTLLFIFSLFFPLTILAQAYYEISGSAFATEGAPLPNFITSYGEKTILVVPNSHAWGAYNKHGKLIRWGIATAGSNRCRDSNQSCRTKIGTFRIFSLGNENCYSKKYPLPSGGAAMPYCMYFNGGQALHGSTDVEFDNSSHGCVRIHITDAKWLRQHFVEAPSTRNRYKGTKIIIRRYN